MEVTDDFGFKDVWRHTTTDDVMDFDLVDETTDYMMQRAFRRRYSRDKNDDEKSDDDDASDGELQVIRKEIPRSNELTSRSTRTSVHPLNTSTSKHTTEPSRRARNATHSLENGTEDTMAATDAPAMTGTLLYTFDDENQTTATVRPIVNRQRGKRDAEATCRDRKFGTSAIVGYIMEPGVLLSLPCQFCDDSSRTSLGAKTWFKFIRDNTATETIFNADLVKLDTHDNAKLNRIYTKPDHTLVIDRFEPKDTGAYFCEIYDKLTYNRIKAFSFKANTIDETSAAAILLAWKTVASTATGITFMSIVDIMVPIQSLKVSNELANYKLPRRPLANTEANWISYTMWSSWGECPTCGKEAERQRKGQCRIRKIDMNTESKPFYLNEVLKLYPLGAPCQSSLFTDQNFIQDAKNEDEVGPCFIECRKVDSGSILGVKMQDENKVGKKSGILRRRDKVDMPPGIPTVPPYTQHPLSHQEGDNVVLMCPGFYAQSYVIWKKDLEVFVTDNLTGRVVIDSLHRINFKTLVAEDSGQYSCYVDFETTVDYFLMVAKKLTDVGSLFPGLYYMLYFDMGACLVFFFIMVLKHNNRFDSTRARAYRTRAAQLKAKGFGSYEETIGMAEKKKIPMGDRNVNPFRANMFEGFDAPKSMNLNKSAAGDESVVDICSVSDETSTTSDDLSEEFRSMNSLKWNIDRSWMQKRDERRRRAAASDSSDLESSSEEEIFDEYAILDSSSGLSFESNYSDTEEDSDIPVKPYWLL